MGLQELARTTWPRQTALVTDSERLSALEAAFLELEAPGLPMHVAGVIELDGPIDMGDLRRHVARRIRRLPRFHQRVRRSRLGLGWSWVDAGRLDLEAHMFRHEIAPHEDLAAVCARIHAESLDLDRPLWQMHLIDRGGTSALVIKMHHSIADGVAGVHVAETLFDVERAGRPPFDVATGHNFAGSASRSLMQAGQAVAGAAFTAAGGPIARPSRFNVSVGPDRAVAFCSVPLADVLRLKRRLGGSVDDVLLAMVALGLRRFSGSSQALRAMVPVSTWVPGRHGLTGNHVTSVFVDLPQDTGDVGAVVARIAAEKSLLRASHAAAGMAMLVQAAGLLPAPLHRAAVRAAGSIPFANLVVSDTPGSDARLSLLGRRITAGHPLIPLPRSVGLSIAAITMCGVMGIGIVSDPKALARPWRLAAEIERSVRRSARAAASPRRRRSPELVRAA